jgi:hypothetical protein
MNSVGDDNVVRLELLKTSLSALNSGILCWKGLEALDCFDIARLLVAIHIPPAEGDEE